MKKKLQRVPDFSSKKPVRPGIGAGGKAPLKDAPPPAAPQPPIKPKATSSKSGRRGG